MKKLLSFILLFFLFAGCNGGLESQVTITMAPADPSPFTRSPAPSVTHFSASPAPFCSDAQCIAEISFFLEETREDTPMRLALYRLDAKGDTESANGLIRVFRDGIEVQVIETDSFIFTEPQSPTLGIRRSRFHEAPVADLLIEEMDQDSYMDFRLAHSRKEEQYFFYYYLWNPATNQFETRRSFTQLGANPTFEYYSSKVNCYREITERQCIIETYFIIQGEAMPVMRVEYWNEMKIIRGTSYYYIDGKWKKNTCWKESAVSPYPKNEATVLAPTQDGNISPTPWLEREGGFPEYIGKKLFWLTDLEGGSEVALEFYRTYTNIDWGEPATGLIRVLIDDEETQIIDTQSPIFLANRSQADIDLGYDLDLWDLNLDGYVDFSLNKSVGTNPFSDHYIYNAKSQQFEFRADFEAMGHKIFVSKNFKQVSGDNSDKDSEQLTYIVADGKMLPALKYIVKYDDQEERETRIIYYYMDDQWRPVATYISFG